jgi:hypothetical protein
MGIFDMISSFLNPQRGYQQAGGQLRQYYNQGQGYLSPYNQQGMEQYQRLLQQANALNNPAALQAEWAKSYQTSPQAQQALAQAQQTGQEEASRMGLMGSSAALGNIQQNAANIQQQDRQQYMNDLMQKYMTSIGLGQSLYGTGAGAANTMAGNAMGMGGAQAAAQFGQANAPGQQFGNILGFLGNLGINWATGRPQQYQQGRMY